MKGLPGSHSEDGALQHTLLCGSVPCNEFEYAFKAVQLWMVDKAVRHRRLHICCLTGASDEDFCNSHEIEMVRVADGVLSYSKISLLLLQPNSFEDVGASQLSSMATTRNLAVEVVSRGKLAPALDRAIPRKTAPALDRAIPRKTAPALDRAIPRKTAPALDRAIPRKTAPALDRAIPRKTARL
ncbi:Arogenate dehydratase/prephenate dehydratase 1, chloroplastic, partial [Cucurbita argyrosperma subsp. sororia]